MAHSPICVPLLLPCLLLLYWRLSAFLRPWSVSLLTHVLLGLDEGWKPLTVCLNLSIINRPKKKSNSAQDQKNPLQHMGQEALKDQVCVQVWAPACHLAPEGYFRRLTKVLTAKILAKLLWQCLGRAWAGQWSDRQAQIQDVSYSISVTAGRDELIEKKALPLLWYWQSSKVK